MTTGIDTTFRILSKTSNQAALSWLLSLLDSEHEEIVGAATRSLLIRRSSAGHRELLHRWSTLSESQLRVIDQHASHFSGTLRDGILNADQEFNENACQAAIRLHEYDLIPTLVRAAEDKANPHAERAAEATVALADHLHRELNEPRDYRNRRDPVLVRQFVYTSLEHSIRQFSQHRRVVLVEAFLILAEKSDSLLKQLLDDPNHPAYSAVLSQLTTSCKPRIIQLICDLLEDAHAPQSVLHVLNRRKDDEFLRALLKKASEKISSQFRSNLKRIESWGWMREDLETLPVSSDEELCGAVQLAVASGLNRLRVFELIRFAIYRGEARSRRAASAALAEFKGGDANELVLLALADSDPEVQSHAVAQLRERGIPGTLQRMVDLLESPHEIVRAAVHAALAEFTFQRYLCAFDMLDTETRTLTGTLVKRVDNDALRQLQAELTSMSRARRIRGIEMAIAMQSSTDVAQEILQLSTDPDHFIRAATAESLARINSPESCERLQEMCLDRAISVQEAAEKAYHYSIPVPDPFAQLSSDVGTPIPTT